MRKFTLFAFLLHTVMLPLMAQTVLNYPTHAMQIGDVVALKGMDVISPGEAGANQVWDFSAAEVGDDFVLNYNEDLTNYATRPQGIAFACTENDSRTPFFQLTKTQRLYYGVEGENAKIEFPEPLVDFKYPFAYQDEFSGKMNGTYTTNGVTTQIEGVYQVTADAWGTLILPNGTQFENVLRIKSVRDYSQDFFGAMYDIKVTRYSYFAEDVRYAIAQVHEVEYKCDCACNSKSIKGYFNPSVERNKVKAPELIAEEKVENDVYTVYPNPFKNEFTLKYNVESDCNVKISVLDLNGKELKVLVNAEQEEGSYSIKPNFSNMKATAVWFLRIQIGEDVYVEKIVKKD